MEYLRKKIKWSNCKIRLTEILRKTPIHTLTSDFNGLDGPNPGSRRHYHLHAFEATMTNPVEGDEIVENNEIIHRKSTKIPAVCFDFVFQHHFKILFFSKFFVIARQVKTETENIQLTIARDPLNKLSSSVSKVVRNPSRSCYRI